MNFIRINLVAIAVATAACSAPSLAAADQLYGALAYSQKSGSYGWSIDAQSQADAENSAINECYKRAGDCQSAIWFRDACGAIAVGEDGGWGADWGRNKTAARNKAMNVCNGYTYNCKVVVTQCTSSSE